MLESLLGIAHKLMATRILGNTLWDYAVCSAAIAGGLAAVWFLNWLLGRKAMRWFRSTASTWDDFAAETLQANVIPALYVLVIYHSLRQLSLHRLLEHALTLLMAAAMTIFAVRAALAVVHHSVQTYWRKNPSRRTETREKSLRGIITVAKFLVWVLAVILLLDNLGFKVSAFVAGLGITGIAVALAAQTILGDLFGYFVIFFDQPFEVGHAIKVEGFSGEVEHIGLKTTRLRGLDGEEVIFSNKFLTDSRVQNFQRMHRRRAPFGFEVEYGTSPEALRAIPDLVKAQVEKFSDATFERTHFREFGSNGLRFEAVFWVETPEYARYLDIQQAVNLGLKEDLARAGIAFAVPARVVHLRGEKAPSPGGAAADGAEKPPVR